VAVILVFVSLVVFVIVVCIKINIFIIVISIKIIIIIADKRGSQHHLCKPKKESMSAQAQHEACRG